jgi:solute:Na+ symporter, SSS family
MTVIDFVVFALYMGGVVFIGYYHFKRNKDAEDYYVGGRSMGAGHVGLSIVATDVGGGFSIGLGGLGFAMGLSGSWLLFTGLIGAWLSAVFIIPRIKKLDEKNSLYTYPDFLRLRYGNTVALLAAVISGIGYMGFTGAQILAGAKLCSATIITSAPFNMEPLQFSLYVIAVITIVYTAIGGLKAVIYTDSVQWVILLTGLIGFAIPISLYKIGGWSAFRSALPPEFFSLSNIDAVQFINWMVTIIPIWLIGMTLYQRMYACADEKSAKRAWFIAGIFEYPVMAFAGVLLGMCARIFFAGVESEMGLPMLLKQHLPIGIAGIVVASYFSAIMSTADSCLMASSGNFVNDIVQRYVIPQSSEKTIMRVSQLGTLVIGVLAVVIAAQFEKVLTAILYAYGFMVAGLFIPTLGAYFWKRSSRAGAFWGMLIGGTTTILLQTRVVMLPAGLRAVGLDPSFYGIVCSAVVFVSISLLFPDNGQTGPEYSSLFAEK